MNPLALERNLVLSAGAGTGKTYSLITLALHLLGGARPGAGPLPPRQLCIVTFTEKAAAQLKERLRTRVEGLSGEGKSAALEAELRASYEALGQPWPGPTFWSGVRDGLDMAQIGTFHALALRWLRRLALQGEAQLAQLLDEASARSLLEECVERTVVDRLDRGDPAVAQLCRDLGFSGNGWAGGLVDELLACRLTLREEGLSVERLPVGSEEGAREELEAHRTALQRAVRDALQRDVPERFHAALGALGDGLAALSPERFWEPGAFPHLRRVAREGLVLTGLRNGNAEALKRVKYGVLGDRPSRCLGLVDLHAAWACAPLERAFRGLLQEIGERYDTELDRRGVMDFAGLLERVRDAWRSSPSARQAAQGRVGALLVDEFQDTNRVQLELVMLLSERREGGPRSLSPTPSFEEVLDLPLEPSFLAIVGDRKQSIYEFRGADVSLFELLAGRIEAAGGQRAFLQRNFRSTPALVELFNRGFSRWMAPSPPPRSYEVAYHEGDALLATRGPGCFGDRIRVLDHAPAESLEAARHAEATALAAELSRLLAPASRPLVRGADGERLLRGGDVAVLLRRYTHLEVYVQALVQAGIRHQVWQGRGFFSAPEVRDVEALLSLLCDPEDSTSLVALLRSPFVGVSDGSLFSLSLACAGKLTLERLRSLEHLPGELPPADSARLQRFLALEDRWRRERDTRPACHLLQDALEQSGYLAAAAAGPHADQVLANLEKLVERATRRSVQGGGGVAELSTELRQLISAPPREAQAELTDGADPDAVQLLTVHQSKGLEWPLVVLAEMGASRFRRSGRFAFERSLGLALRASGAQREGVTSARFRNVSDELSRRADAEETRLFYVALTRARDQLILSGAPSVERGARRGWGGCAAGVLADDLEALREQVPWVPMAGERPSLGSEPVSPELVHALREHLNRIRNPAVPPFRMTLPLDAWVAAADCPRRYWLLHVAQEARPDASRELAAERTQIAVRARVTNGSPEREIQVQGHLLVVREDGAGRPRELVGVADALSPRAVMLAHRFFERTAEAVLSPARTGVEGTGAVQTLSLREGRLHARADPELAAVEAEVTAARIERAHRAAPGPLPPESCRALGCELFSRCHPGAGSGSAL